ncbi:Decaprenyl-diphosphate synthase subunit 1 [Taenia crassiceps]|uniref:Decaprenyl-diphosphate synthase subunit 1 n=1 Tax=Taenia crassiceps TaxID=6207 RepID=A0ABR4QJ53_9CEST
MAACANGHNDYSSINSGNKNMVTDAQHAIAVIAEMIHTASLIHDDLIDKAEMRRKKLATYRKFGNKRLQNYSRKWGTRKLFLFFQLFLMI